MYWSGSLYCSSFLACINWISAHIKPTINIWIRMLNIWHENINIWNIKPCHPYILNQNNMHIITFPHTDQTLQYISSFLKYLEQMHCKMKGIRHVWIYLSLTTYNFSFTIHMTKTSLCRAKRAMYGTNWPYIKPI